MFRTQLNAVASSARRVLPSLGLAAALLASVLGQPAPAAAAAQQPEPTAQIQLVVKEVKIHDDREGALFGEGEMGLFVGIWRCNQGVPLPCVGGSSFEGLPESMDYSFPNTAGPIARSGALFNAGTGETVTLDRLVPRHGDVMWGGNTSEERGFAVYAGERYVVQFDMGEWDNAEPFGTDEYMGYAFHFLDTGELGLGIGTHTARSLKNAGRSQGDYTVTYEIRHAPLPDLRPVNIQVHDLPGSTNKLVCMAVVNSGVSDAGPFELALKVDGVVPPSGRASAGRLASGDAGDLCVEVALPTSGQHRLAAHVDEPGALIEFKETNNVYEQPYQATGPAVAPTGTPAPSGTHTPATTSGKPDLVVSAIEVNGRVPNGKDDCTDGKNDVTVVVKNGGAAGADDVVVRLAASGGGALEKTVGGLDAGQERQVRFDDVRLKEGERTLTATLDPEHAVAEADEDNNERKVTARCTG